MKSTAERMVDGVSVLATRLATGQWSRGQKRTRDFLNLVFFL